MLFSHLPDFCVTVARKGSVILKKIIWFLAEVYFTNKNMIHTDDFFFFVVGQVAASHW